MGNWGNQITTLVVFVLLTRLLGPEAFGLVAMASVFTSFVAIFAEQGLSQAIVQREELEPKHLDTAFWTNVVIGFGLTLLGILLSGVVANIYNQPELQPIVALLSITLLLTALSSTQQALLQRSLNFRALAIRQLTASIVGGIVGIAMALMGAGVYALVGKSLTTGVVSVVVLWRASNWRPRFSYSKRHFRDLFGFGMSMVGVKTTNFIRTRMDDFLIGYFLGPEALGYYTVAYRLGRLTLDMFTSVMSSVAVATFARLQDDFDRLRAALYKFSSMAGLITFPIFVGLIVLAPELILALSGEKWLPSAAVMRVLSIGGFALSLQQFLAFLIISLGRPDRLFLLNTVVAVAIAVAFTISAQFGIIYVAFAYVIVNVAFYGVFLGVLNHMLPLNLRRYLIDSWRFMIPSVIMGIVAFLLNSHLYSIGLGLYLRLILAIAVAVAVYLALVYVLYRAAFVETRGLALSFIPLSRRTALQASSSPND